MIDVLALGEEHLALARESPHGRSAHTFLREGPLRQAIIALNRYLERQRLAEQLPDAQRREELSYDTALARLAKSVCPGCERPVDLKNDRIDFCPHCGIGLFDHCGHCATRKSAFQKFCHACGTTAGPGLTPLAPDPA